MDGGKKNDDLKNVLLVWEMNGDQKVLQYFLFIFFCDLSIFFQYFVFIMMFVLVVGNRSGYFFLFKDFLKERVYLYKCWSLEDLVLILNYDKSG